MVWQASAGERRYADGTKAALMVARVDATVTSSVSVSVASVNAMAMESLHFRVESLRHRPGCAVGFL